MKKIKRLFSILMMSLVALFVFASTNKAQAATTSEGINIEYKTYKASDYDNFINNFESTYGASLIDVLSDMNILDNYNYSGILDDYPECTDEELEEEWNKNTFLGKTGVLTYTQAVTARNAFLNLSETNSFVPGEEIVIVPYVRFYNSKAQDIGFTALTLYFNFKPKNGSSWDWTNTNEMFSTADISDAAKFYSKVERGSGRNKFNATITSSTSSIAGANSGLGNLGLYLAIGSDEVLYGNLVAGATRVTLGSSLSGDYKISVNAVKSGSNSTFYELNGFTDGAGSTKKINTSPAFWTETEKVISVVGANGKTGIKSVSVGGTALNSTNSTITHTNPSDLDAGQSTYAYNTGVSGNPTLSIELNSGSITGIKWSNTSFANASSGAPLTANADGTYTVDMSSVNTGENIYLAVNVLATDGTTNRTHYISIPKAKSNDALLNNLVVKNSSGVQIPFANGATFNANSNAYEINVPDTITTSGLKINADFDSIQTATITTNTLTDVALTDGQDYSVTAAADLADGKTITVTCKAQDGTTTKSYNIKINHLSSNALLPSNPTVTANGTGTNVVVNKTDPTGTSNGTITVTGIDYTGTSFTFNPTLADGQTAVITLGGSTYTPGSTFTFPSGTGYGANVVTGTVVVTAEDGTTTKTYDVTITRSPADTDASITGITVNYTGGSQNVTNPIVGTNTVTGIPYGTTAFSVSVALADGTIKHVEIGSGNGFNTGQTSYSESGFTLATNYSNVSTTVVITVKAENQNQTSVYTLVVKRADANDDVSINSFTVSYTDGSKSVTSPVKTENGTNKVTGVPYGITTFSVSVALSNGTIKNVQIGAGNAFNTGQASYSQSGFTLSTGYSGVSTTVIITVEAENRNESATYTLVVERTNANNDASITGVTVTYNGGTKNGAPDSSGNISISGVPYGITSFDVTVTLSDGTTKAVEIGSGNGQNTGLASYTETGFTFPTGYSNVSKDVDITVWAQDRDISKPYKLTVERDDANDDATITSVTVSYTGQTGVTVLPDSSGNMVVNNVPYTVNTFTVLVTLTDGTQKTLYFDNVQQASAQSYTLPNVAFPTGYENISKTIAIKVQAQDLSKPAKEYSLTVNRIDAAKDNKLADLEIENNEGTSLGSFDSATQKFSDVADQEAWISSYTFTATLDNASLATATVKYYIRVGTQTSRTTITNTTVNFSDFGNDTTLIIEIKAQNPNEVNTIEIPISRKSPDGNGAFTFTASADIVYPNGATGTPYNVTLTGPSNGTYTNSTNIIYDTKTVTLTVEPESDYTKVEIDGQLFEAGETATGSVTFTSLLADPKSLTVKIYTQNNYSQPADTKVFTFTRLPAENDLTFTEFGAVHPTTGVAATEKNAPVNEVYTYIVKQSEFGNTFKVKAAVAPGSRSHIYVSTNINDFNDPHNMNQALLYNADTVYNIGTTLYVGIISEQEQKFIRTINSEFTDERDSNNTISKIEVYDITDGKNVALTDKYSFGDGSDHNPAFTVAYGVKKLKYVVTLQSLVSSLAPGSKDTSATGNVWVYEQELSVGSSNVANFVCTAENLVDNNNPYKFTVTRSQGSSQKLMDNLVINGIDCKDTANITNGYILNTFNPYTNSFDIVFPRGTSMFNIEFTYSAGASMYAYVDGDTSQDFTSTPCFVTGNYDGGVMKFKVQITAEIGGTPSVYTINVYVADQEYTISDINILKQDQSGPMLNNSDPAVEFDFSASSTGTQNHNVVYKNNDFAYIQVIKASRSSNAEIIGLSSNNLFALTPGQPTVIEITIKSEYAKLNSNVVDQYRTYKISINRAQANNNPYLNKLEVYLDGTLVSFDDGLTFTKENGNYSISDIPLPSTCEVVAELDDPNASMIGDIGFVTVDLIEGTKLIQNLKITVTAENGSTKKEYKIKLSLEEYIPSPINTLNSLQAVAGGEDRIENFNNNDPTYEINVAANIDKILITAVKGNDLETVTIVCDDDSFSSETTSQSFDLVNGQTKTIKVIVSAEDENVEDREFTIKVTRADYDDDNTLKDLKFNGTTLADFNPEKDEYKVYVTGDVTDGYLEATANSTLATIAPYNDVNNKKTLAVGENKFEVIVSAENGDPKTYTVYVYRDPSLYLSNLEVIVNNSNLIEGFTKENTLYPSTGEYNVDYSYSTAEFIATPEATGDDADLLTITYNGSPNNNVSLSTGSKSYVVKVTAPSKAYKEYTVVIKREEGNSDAYITQYITEAGETLALEIGTYTYKYRVDKTTAIYNPTVSFSTGASHTFDNVKNTALSAGTVNSKTIVVTSEDGTVTNTYTFYVYTASNDINIGDINVLDTIGGNDVVDLDGITIVDYDKDTTSYTLNVPYAASANVYLEIISDAKVMVNNAAYTNSSQPLVVGDNIFEIYVISEYGQLNPDATGTKSQTYTVTIVMEAPNSDPSLSQLVIKTANGMDLLVDVNTGNTQFVSGLAGLTSVGNKQYEANYTIANIGNISAVSISYVATFNSTGVTPVLVSGVVNWALGDAVGNAGENSVFTFEKSIVCTATDGTIATYNITLMRGPLDPDEDNSVIDIKVEDSMGNSYLNNFTQGQPTYGPYEIPYGIQSYTITASKNEFTYAQLSCVNANDAADSGFATRPIGTDFYDEQYLVQGKNYREIVYKVYATANKGTGAKGTEYYITLRFLAPSNDNKLSSIKVDSVDVPNYNPETTDYTLVDIRAYTTETAEFKVTLSDASAKVISINGVAPKDPVAGVYTQTVDLKVGIFEYKIIVQAQNGDIKEYNITIQRDSETPYLSDLAVSGQVLLDNKDNATVFNKATNEYRVIVTYITMNATIVASVDNTNYTMSCTNSTVNGLTSTLNTHYFDVTNLAVGENTFTISVRSAANKTNEYKLTIIRRNQASMNTDIGSIDIVEVPEFKEDYDDLQTIYDKNTYNYIVPNKVVDLDVIVDLKNIDDIVGAGATYEIYNATGLKVGDNKIIILVTAEDKVTTKAIIVDVYREKMQYEFDKEAYSFDVTDLEKDEKGRSRYQVNLNNKNASAIDDFTKYIKFDAASNNITVKEVTDKNNDNRNEVVLEITDGDETEQVVIQLNTTANNGNAVFDWGVWILLGVAIVILIIILIAVNRDKYGSVTNKRKKLD